MKAIEVIHQAFDQYNPGVAFSGGSDSMVLLHMVVSAGYKPQVFWVNNGLQYPQTRQFNQQICENYGLELIEVDAAPENWGKSWERYGWPMLGKMVGHSWNKRNRDVMDFRIGLSYCCQKYKITPGRQAMLRAGLNCQITGTKAGADDRTRAFRAYKDKAPIAKVKNIWIAKPLTNWTDLMVRRYAEAHNLPNHPEKVNGVESIGCMICGGGAQLSNSLIKIARLNYPKKWWEAIVDWKLGEIILAMKYSWKRSRVQKALREAGGLEKVAKEHPQIFDYTRLNPVKARYRK